MYLNYLDVTNFRVPCSEIGLVLMRVHRLPQVFVGLASLYVSLASTSALRWGEHDNSVSRPSVWMTKAVGVLLVILTACRWYLAATQRS